MLLLHVLRIMQKDTFKPIPLMKYSLLIISAFVLVFTSAKADIKLSPQSKISLLTCSPGQDAYALFGHSAIRVTDSVKHFDSVFNYGVFSFNTPNFYGKFISGRTDYMLGVHSYKSFIAAYHYENRSIEELDLNLTLEQRQRIMDFLSENYKPENRYYRYNFLYDNCASRIRDVMETTLGNSLVWHATDTLPSFRKELNIYLQKSLWLKLGINLIMGPGLDEKTTYRQTMFLPDYLHSGFENATFNGKPLVKEKKVLLKATPETLNKGLRPYALILILMHVIIFTGFNKLRESKLYSVIMVLYYSVIGIAGIILWYISLFSVHPAVFPNIHLLWLWPTHLILPFLAFKKKLPQWTNTYLKVNIALALLTDALIIFGVQHASADLIILINMLIIANLSFQRKHTPIRYIINYFKNKKQRKLKTT